MAIAPAWISTDKTHVSIMGVGGLGFDYEIPWDQINTHEKLVKWIVHLSQKNWCDGQLIQKLAVTVCQHFDWQPPYGA